MWFLLGLFLILPFQHFAQENYQRHPSLSLEIHQLKEWTSEGDKAILENVVSVPLAQRFINPNTQFNPSLSNQMQVMYAPDGMNNLGNYVAEIEKFNLFNFTHWQYIDKLIWFGGPILIPAAPWVNAAHRNGVKVYGNIFFAPNVYGGSNEKVNDFLEKDEKGSFISAEKLKEIVEYYGFDGWFVNMETNVDSVTAKLMYDFVKEFKSILPKDKEVIWYDAMLMNGKVRWQNQLNEKNKMFLQNGATRVSDGIFVNFFWKGSAKPLISKSTAQSIGRSEFEVYTGVDLWPDRNQKPFEEKGNEWMASLYQEGKPLTSLALFVPDLVFRNERYSTFDKNVNQATKFYQAERHLFSGYDQNPAKVDKDEFKGLSNWIPATSVIQALPFETNFNTGHGQNKFHQGGLSSEKDWHDMNKQDILPTWQFAFEGNSDLRAEFIFHDAYEGGSCLSVQGNLNDRTSLKLYKTNLKIKKKTYIDIVYKSDQRANSSLQLALAFDDRPSNLILFKLKEGSQGVWQSDRVDLKKYAGKKLLMIALQFKSEQLIEDYEVKIGQIKADNKSKK